MKLGEKQRLFASMIPALISKAIELGFEVTLGDAYRDPKAFGEVGDAGPYGARFSCHKSRLAIDLNLFLHGEYMAKTESHRALGEWWEQQHELCCWGGRFNDGNHYSMTHQGRK